MSPTDGSEMNIIDLVKAGQYLQAIKLHREQTGMGLKESKEQIDNLRAGIELKALKCTDIDEMKEKIQNIHLIGGAQKDFLLDMVEEAYFLGEDAGEQTGYHKALAENNFTADDDEREAMISEEAYDEGWSSGQHDGYEEGYERGEEKGYESGHNDGRVEGYNEGKLEGHESGLQNGLEQGRAERNE